MSEMPLPSFVLALSWEDLTSAVREQTKLCLLDTLGAALAARGTPLSNIVHDMAVRIFGGSEATLWQDGRETSAPGAAFANAMTIDALDIHDGHSWCKGHAGVAVVPAALAMLQCRSIPISGRELLALLTIGYEVSVRAGIALHSTTQDYHSSGAWNALGCAAMGARRMRLTPDQTLHALGIAEFYGPRSQIMRCVDHPTMLKDGSGWGAMTGVTAALLAQQGFTGRPALTIEADSSEGFWRGLGNDWEFLRQYFKPHAVCRWAQPAVEAVIELRKRSGITFEDVRRIRVITFHQATRLSTRKPTTTEIAQYSLPFAVAAAMVHGQLLQDQVTGEALSDSRIMNLIERIDIVESPEYSRQFPARRFADISIETIDGELHKLATIEPRWDSTSPPTTTELVEKFRALTSFLSHDDQEYLIETVLRLDHCENCEELIQRLANAPIQ